MPYSPSLIDPTNKGQYGPSSATMGPWVYQGNLYQLLSYGSALTGGAVELLKSTDGGVTWVELDTANHPPYINGNGNFDGDHKVYVAFRTNDSVLPAAINLATFDLSTGTWSAAYGTVGAPTTGAVAQIWQRPDNTLLVVHDPRAGTGVTTGTGFDVAIYDLVAAAWVSTFDAGTEMTALAGWDSTQTRAATGQSTGMIDSTGRVHLFWNTSSIQTVPVVWGNRVFYQAIELNNALGSFFDFPGQAVPVAGQQALQAYTGPPMGQAQVVGSQLVLPVLAYVGGFPAELACVYLGAPVDNPVWSLDTAKPIDPTASVDGVWAQQAPNLTSDGSSLYAIYSAQDATGFINFARLRLCQTFNLAAPADGWSASTVFDMTTDSPPGFYYVGQYLQTPTASATGSATVFLSVLAQPQGDLFQAAYWMGNFSTVLKGCYITLYGYIRVPKRPCDFKPAPKFVPPARRVL